MTLSLPERLIDKTIGFGESSYGVNRVTLILADGRRIHEVFLAWGHEIVKIGNRAVSLPNELDFQLADVVDVILEVKH